MKLATFEIFKKLQNYDENSVILSGELLKKSQRVLLAIAEDVISLCEDENIWYQLGGGTALGAVRHHGFIPWDDDIDINILRKDYSRFLEKLKARYGDKYNIQNSRTPDYGIASTKIRLRGSVYRDKIDIQSDDCGFFVDIFILENTFDNIFLRYSHGVFCTLCAAILSCRKFYQDREFMREVARQNPEVKKIFYIKIALGWLVSFLSLRRWAMITDVVYGLCKNNNSKYVSFPAGRKHYFGEMYLRDGMVNTIEMPFEGHSWRVARDYDKYFTALYGPDYMIPHTEAQREHHVILELKFPENFDFGDMDLNSDSDSSLNKAGQET